VPTFGVGWGAAELLVRVIDGDQPKVRHVLLDTELIVRVSCGAPVTDHPA
jgi:DNA-binding LacI/PurR family transcriptional regulator